MTTVLTALLLALLPTQDDEFPGDRFVSGVRQLTFEGRRAGEGYFAPDGRSMVFQSERQADNPFYQIYRLDLETGDTTRSSNGVGKTTCGWVGLGGRVLFASTHHDPRSAELQQAELDFRASGQTRRYSWDYDPAYELYAAEPDGTLTRLTDAAGYDAEGSFSPDGTTVLFASNRDAYVTELTGERKELLERDPSYFIDLYRMNADGSGVERLTDTPGYDGGPFFSPGGERICWRRFDESGATAEILTAAADGSDVRRLTETGAMSWAPFYHPSGEYLVYTTNVHGFANFELYLVRADGGGEPVRVTGTKGFDGLPVFHPDGDRLSWTSNRTADGTSQIFLAKWDHAAAREALGLDAPPRVSASPRQPANAYRPGALAGTVEALTTDAMAGRKTGTEGARLATELVASRFEAAGLGPGGSLVGEDGYFDPFEFTAGVSLGDGNRMTVQTPGKDFELTADEDFRPLAFSATGEFGPAPVVFAGYGLRVPSPDEDDPLGGYDSFVHLDVTDQWVLVFRFLPEDLSPEKRQEFSRYAGLRRKAMTARDLGAKGLLVVSGPSSQVKSELASLRFDGSLAGSGLPVISLSDAAAKRLIPDLAERQASLDGGDLAMGELLDGVTVSATVDIEQATATGRNVLGLLRAGEEPADELIVVGAHVDHLGVGAGGSSLARDGERDAIHRGADDNASGVAAMLAIAEDLAAAKAAGVGLERDVLFAAWSGEELGLLGASAFLDDFQGRLGDAAEGEGPRVVACLNMDMVGRLRNALVLQGVGSSPAWKPLIERRNVPVGLPLTLSDDSYIPTDASAFFARRVPILSAFTGNHEDYHTPRDTADKLNYEGAADTARLMGLITRSLATSKAPIEYREQAKPKDEGRRANLRAYLGTIPDYAQTGVKGVKLSGVSAGGPASEAGVLGGDVIVEVAGSAIENIYDYTYAIEALKVGEPVSLVVERDGVQVEMTVTPGSRD